MADITYSVELATVENMRKHADRRDVFAYSPLTGERYSAAPGDYFWAGSEPLTDVNGDAMILATETITIRPV